MLGDSVTFGYGVDQTQSFPAELERLLNQSGKYEVINAGVPGYSIVDEAALLPAVLGHFNPDLVIWTVVSNDYDDSLGVGPDGRTTVANIDYVVDAGFIAHWGHNGTPYVDVDDFRRSMLPAVRASLDGNVAVPPAKPSALAAWLGSHSLVYAFLTSHAISIPKLMAKPKPTEVELLGRYKTTDGRYYLSQFFSPVYSSRHAIERANQALERAGELSKQAGVPIVLLNDGLPMDSRWMNSRAPIVYQDLSDYLGESPVDFFFRNNLGWDGHPSPKGTKKIAEALRRMVACLGYIGKSGDCPASAASGPEMRKFWDDFETRRRKFVDTYYGAIDLDQFRGIHQILGGIFPARVFPGALARRANVLLPGGRATSISITGTLPGAADMMIRFTVFASGKSLSQDANLKPGDNKIDVDLKPLSAAIEASRDPIELQMECVSAMCPALRLHAISRN